MPKLYRFLVGVCIGCMMLIDVVVWDAALDHTSPPSKTLPVPQPHATIARR